MFETRIPEPAVMSDQESCKEYEKVNRDSLTYIFNDLIEDNLQLAGKSVAELGCGTGDFTRAIMNEFNVGSYDAFDGSQVMLDIAKSKGVPNGVEYKCELFENISEQYDVILSVSTMHHTQTINEWWDAIMAMSKPGTKICILDLLRPQSKKAMDYVLNLPGQPNKSSRFQQDFEKSLKASFRIDEIEESLAAYPDLHLVTDKVRMFSTNWYFMSVIGERV